MSKGYYNAVSGLLTQQRVLNTISNNITNTSTPGYKKDVMASTTFGSVLAARTGNTDKRATGLGGELSAIRTVQELVTVFTQGGINTTGRKFDFCIQGNGFFEIQGQDGPVYTRSGAFTLDAQGYLCLQDVGRVMGEGGPIFLGTAAFTVGPNGTITLDAGGTAGRIRLVDFADYGTLSKNAAGLFTSTAAPGPADATGTSLVWQALETSNVDMVEETVSMMEAQRAFQSASQMLRMYDQLNEKSNEIGKL